MMVFAPFKSLEHKRRFKEAIIACEVMQKTPLVFNGKFDVYYASALFILTADLATWQKSQRYISKRGIDFPALLKEVDFSSGYLVMVKLAGNLFNGDQHVDPVELIILDRTNFSIAIDAIKVRRYSLFFDEFKDC